MNSEAMHINQKLINSLEASESGVILSNYCLRIKETLDKKFTSLLCEPLRTFASFAVKSRRPLQLMNSTGAVLMFKVGNFATENTEEDG